VKIFDLILSWQRKREKRVFTLEELYRHKKQLPKLIAVNRTVDDSGLDIVDLNLGPETTIHVHHNVVYAQNTRYKKLVAFGKGSGFWASADAYGTSTTVAFMYIHQKKKSMPLDWQVTSQTVDGNGNKDLSFHCAITEENNTGGSLVIENGKTPTQVLLIDGPELSCLSICASLPRSVPSKSSTFAHIQETESALYSIFSENLHPMSKAGRATLKAMNDFMMDAAVYAYINRPEILRDEKGKPII
jgi:hypothetical protein